MDSFFFPKREEKQKIYNMYSFYLTIITRDMDPYKEGNTAFQALFSKGATLVPITVIFSFFFAYRKAHNGRQFKGFK